MYAKPNKTTKKSEGDYAKLHRAFSKGWEEASLHMDEYRNFVRYVWANQSQLGQLAASLFTGRCRTAKAASAYWKTCASRVLAAAEREVRQQDLILIAPYIGVVNEVVQAHDLSSAGQSCGSLSDNAAESLDYTYQQYMKIIAKIEEDEANEEEALSKV
jgi:hypothetical protein